MSDDLFSLTPPEALARGEDALRAALGGAVRTVRGYTLDVRYQFLEEQNRRAMAALVGMTLPLEMIRMGSAMQVAMFSGPIEPGVTVEDLHVPGGAGDRPARLYRPAQLDPQVALLVFFHYGGGVLGDLDTCHRFCSLLAATSGGPVLSVSYRLAPEHPFPAGVEDAISSFAWAHANAQTFGARAGAAAVGGDSQGGNLAAVVALAAKRGLCPAPLFQLLIYPAVDYASDAPSMRDFADAYPLTSQTMTFFRDTYAPAGVDVASDWRLAPLYADKAGLAPALVYTAAFDPLLDQGAAYADALTAGGVETHYKRFDTIAHAFTAWMGAVPAAADACREIATNVAAWLRR